MNEKQIIWDFYNKKKVFVCKKAGSFEYFYKGKVLKVLEDGIQIQDHKIGLIFLTFEGLSILDFYNEVAE